MPGGAGVDLLAAASTAAEPAADVRDVNGLRHGVDADVGGVIAFLASCSDGANAVLAPVAERHRRAGWGSHAR
jgi:hypothetical protein